MLLAALLIGMSPFQTPKVEPGEPKLAASWKITDKAVEESSGLGASRLAAATYYTHNDSGDVARFFRFDKRGTITGVFRLSNVKAIDWEDMEVATVDGKNYIYLGDTGDNARARNEIFVHRVAEPSLRDETAVIENIQTYTFVYPDRKNDCEALLVNPADGSIWFVTKARDQKSSVYVARNPKPGSVQKLELVFDDLKINTGGLGGNLVTGGSVSPDGKKVILKTYSGGYLYSVNQEFGDWVKSKPIPVQFPLEKQGEAVCFSTDNAYLISSSEGSPCPISVFTVPSGTSR
ncbi:MAG: hypothetical protein KF836_00070 [Fimbriimonadaceae bacterium]|nr:hypothetical protein [Fimbriimonadaceae bacterium]